MASLATCVALVTLTLAPTALASPIGQQSRISQMGPDGNAGFDAFDPHVAYNATTGRSLVVWEGDNLGTGENEIHARMVDAAGNPIGLQITLSDMGPPGNAAFDAEDPAVVYNPRANEFLVVWNGDDVTDEEHEIFGQRVNSAGTQVGTNDFRISQMGPDGDAGFDAFDPQVAYNPRRNQYVVVWEGEDGPPTFAAGEREIFGQRLNAAGAQIGTDDFRISNMGNDGDPGRDAFDPYVAYNSITNQYLAVWEGDDGTPPLAAGEREIFGQLVSAGGAEIGTNDFRISQMGADGDAGADARDPALVYNSTSNEFLVVWEGDPSTPPLAANEFEIFGQLVSAAGVEIGTNDFRISDMGADGNSSLDAHDPRQIAYSTQGNEYLVVWEGDDVTNQELEIFGQRLDSLGLPLGTNDFRISQMGPDANLSFDGNDPAAAYDPRSNTYMVAWEGDTNAPPLVDEEFEIYVRRAASGAPPADTTAPKLSLRGRRVQSMRRLVRMRVRCDEDCTVRATGKITIKGRVSAAVRVRLRAARRAVPAGKRRTVKLRLTRRARRAVARVLRRARRARTAGARRRAARRIRARIKVVARDAAKNKRTRRRTVTAKTPRRR